MKIAILLALFVAGCATQPKIQVPVEPVTIYKPIVLDEKCAALAKYAKAVAIMRDLNVKIDDVNFVLPKIPNLPVGTIQRYVYYRSDPNSLVTTSDIYTECTTTGYDKLMRRFNVEETVYNLEQETDIKSEIAKKTGIAKKKRSKK